MPKYAKIIVDISHESMDRPFTYRIPAAFHNRIAVGSCVRIPFGRGNKLLKGYVVALSNQADFPDEKIKEIESILVSQDDSEGRMMQLAAWIKEHYGSTMIQALKIVLPVKKEVKPVEKKTIELLLPKEDAEVLLEECKRKHQHAKVRILEELIEEKVLDYQLVRGKLNVSLQTLNKLQEQGVIRIHATDYFRNPIVIEKSSESDKELLPAQQEIVDDFTSEYHRGIRRTYLIRGITGSGKTEVYIRMIKEVVKSGKQAIFLIPEISLTYQNVVRFYKRFGDKVSITFWDAYDFEATKAAGKYEFTLNKLMSPKDMEIKFNDSSYSYDSNRWYLNGNIVLNDYINDGVCSFKDMMYDSKVVASNMVPCEYYSWYIDPSSYRFVELYKGGNTECYIPVQIDEIAEGQSADYFTITFCDSKDTTKTIWFSLK